MDFVHELNDLFPFYFLHLGDHQEAIPLRLFPLLRPASGDSELRSVVVVSECIPTQPQH